MAGLRLAGRGFGASGIGSTGPFLLPRTPYIEEDYPMKVLLSVVDALFPATVPGRRFPSRLARFHRRGADVDCWSRDCGGSDRLWPPLLPATVRPLVIIVQGRGHLAWPLLRVDTDVSTSGPKSRRRSGLGVPLSSIILIRDAVPQVLGHELQDCLHVRFLHGVEPFHEVVDGCSRRQVLEEGIHRQPGASEHPVARSPCPARSPPRGSCSS